MTPPGRVVLGVLLAGLPVAALGGGPRIPAEPADWAQDAYVWQRVWSPALAASLRAHAARFQRIDVLAAELDFSSAVPKRIVPQVDWPLLRGLGQPVVVVVRSGAAPLAATPQGTGAAAALLTACADVVKAARLEGVGPAELQLDLDAPSGRLASYCDLLRALRGRLGELPLAITVLPDWLGRPEFKPLVEAAGSYVLQVHSLERPQAANEPFALCVPARARAWIRRASALGVPFRVALPTYGYRVGFGADGRFIGLQAEGPARAWPAGTVVRPVWSDAPALAGLVRELAASPPDHCRGLIWFRLPSDDDLLAWHWPTLERVMLGQAPAARLALVATPDPNGEVDLAVINSGEVQMPLAPLPVAWTGARLLAADGIGGWQVERAGDAAVRLLPPAGDETRLFPGQTLQIGWIRLDQPAHIAAALPPSAP